MMPIEIPETEALHLNTSWLNKNAFFEMSEMGRL